MSNLKQLYRVQNGKETYSDFLPVKRVILSNLGKITFMPDKNRYIYFSRTTDHHFYYIMKSISRLINSELKKLKKNKMSLTLDVPDHLKCFDENFKYDINALNALKKYFGEYVQPQEVEFVAFNYLRSFCNLLNNCSILNIDKTKPRDLHSPEVSDITVLGGAYGINGIWLELFNSCIVTTDVARFDLNKFFEIITSEPFVEAMIKSNADKKTWRNLFTTQLQKSVNHELIDNPDFALNGSTKTIVDKLETIKKRKLYNQDDKTINDDYLDAVIENFKEELEMNI